MLSTAFALAILTTTGCMLLYKKLPRRMRKFMEKHALLTDLFALIATYMLLGGTLTALIAAAIVGIMVSVLLHISNNPDDYLYLFDLRDIIKAKLGEVKKVLDEYSIKYKEMKKIDLSKVVDATLTSEQ